MNCHWLRDHGGDVEAVHIHWPEKLWNSGKSIIEKLNLIRLRCEFLRACGNRGVLRIWTLHNWIPHNNGSWVDRLGNFALAFYSDVILVHSESVRRKVARCWGVGKKVLVMPSGNYRGVYPNPRSSAAVRNELGLDAQRPICAMLGHLRQNKGVAEVVEAARRLGEHYQWLVGGHVDDQATADLLKSWRNYRSVRVIDRRLDDQEFADYSAAADCVLLPYHRSTGSGAMLAALTFGRGVVASKIPAFEELVGNEKHAAEFVRPKNPSSLVAGIERFFGAPLDQRHAAAERLVVQYDWDKVIAPVADQLRSKLDACRCNPARSGKRRPFNI
ncbi:MAG: glycosyltransferase family 4 protein [Planctomycetota bacterium]